MSLGEFIPSSNTKLLLHLNGDSTDSSGNGNNGTDTAITYSQANGRFGMGAGFNGSSSYISIATRFFSSYSGNFTISAWIYGSSIVASEEPIYCEADVYGGPRLRLMIINGKPHIGFFVSGVWYTAEGANNISTNIWNHLICVKNGTTLLIYLNGVLQNTGACPLSTDTHYGNSEIGRYRSPSGYYYDGSIDEVIVENVAWSAEKVKKYYTMTKGRFGIL